MKHFCVFIALCVIELSRIEPSVALKPGTAATPVTASHTSAVTNSTTVTTTIPVTTQPPTPDYWVVRTTDQKVCILFDATISVTFRNQTKIVPKPHNGSYAHGTCELRDQQSISIIYEDSANLTFLFQMNDKAQYQMSKVYFNHNNLSVEGNVSTFWANNKAMVSSKMYTCNYTETVYSNNNRDNITLSFMRLEAFANKTSDVFDTDAVVCGDDTKVSNLVPIIVGACLAALILIVLIAYLIGRKRSRRGYESV
jgi:lysosomal-associated membrane protein 1/2